MRSKVFEILSSSSSSSPINFEREIVVVEREKKVPRGPFLLVVALSFVLLLCVKFSSRKGERNVSREISFVSFFEDHRRESSDEKRL